MKNLMIIFIMIACTFVMAQPKWVSLDGNNTPQAMSIKVLSEDANQIKVQIDVYGYFEQTIQIHGQNYLTVRIPNTAMIMQKGKPCLPKFADLIQIPEKVKVTISDVQKEVVKMAISHPIAPSNSKFIKLFISTAYSTGNSFDIGDANPLTIIAFASSSDKPLVIK